MVSVHFQGKPFSITVIQAYAPTTRAEEAKLNEKKDVLFIIGDWNAKVGS